MRTAAAKTTAAYALNLLLSDAWIGEKLQNTLEENNLFIRPQQLPVRVKPTHDLFPGMRLAPQSEDL